MAHDPVADDADAAVLEWTGLPPIKHEDLPISVRLSSILRSSS
jgi:hypothetical protein